MAFMRALVFASALVASLGIASGDTSCYIYNKKLDTREVTTCTNTDFCVFVNHGGEYRGGCGDWGLEDERCTGLRDETVSKLLREDKRIQCCSYKLCNGNADDASIAASEAKAKEIVPGVPGIDVPDVPKIPDGVPGFGKSNASPTVLSFLSAAAVVVLMMFLIY
ncbi:hypothetical protein L596_022444 [Steinernema carpocapsae]|uniref:Activin types I and II receptor domain-containing protein n=1 Tax=Steinernema carpocapsae TaxID=34508 RepID=A0A4U5MM45_STECR|nr:hypothetical protein L596_022444 [Steinernema carpocapsae]